jgi:hypothetical protein
MERRSKRAGQMLDNKIDIRGRRITMKTWRTAAKDSLLSGSLASIASALTLIARGGEETHHPFGHINAVSHWIWGHKAIRKNKPTLRHTLTGYVIHHSASLFWAVLYEKFLNKGNKTPAEIVVDTAIVAGVAAAVDMKCTPERLTPGFEQRLSNSSLTLVYASFAIGLAAGALLNNRRR